MKRKLRNYALLVLTAGLFGLANTGCPACNLAAPTYQSDELHVDLSNVLPTPYYITGPGEFLPSLTPLLAQGGKRTINLGQVFQGNRFTFALWTKDQKRLGDIVCVADNNIHFENAEVYARAAAVIPGVPESEDAELNCIGSGGLNNTTGFRRQ
jgi:hypothetical protein